MASTKILLLIGLCLLTFITMVGGNPTGEAYGFRYWKRGLAMHPYYTTGTTGRFLGWWSVVRYAAFTVAGPDLISVSAACWTFGILTGFTDKAFFSADNTQTVGRGRDPKPSTDHPSGRSSRLLSTRGLLCAWSLLCRNSLLFSRHPSVGRH